MRCYCFTPLCFLESLTLSQVWCAPNKLYKIVPSNLNSTLHMLSCSLQAPLCSQYPHLSTMTVSLHATLTALCLSFILTFLNTQADTTPGEIYWNSMLPNTPMPRAVSNILSPSWDLTSTLHPSAYDGEVLHDQRFMFYERDQDSVKTKENKEVGYDQRLMFYERDHRILESGNEEVLHDQRLIFYGRKQYSRSNSERNEVPINPSSAPWFLERDLYQGKEMKMKIPRPGNNGYTFASRQEADMIPFASDKFTTILEQLSIKQESQKSEQMKVTLKECELPAEKDEVRTCVTSLESMIDFSIKHLGKNIQAVSTEAEKDTKLQKFTMLKGIKKIGQDKIVACHTLNYAYAVFYCHVVEGARAYLVPFVGASGTKVMSVGVCHTNTAAWRHEHESFKILKVKPGGEAVCHFLPEYNVLWTRK